MITMQKKRLAIAVSVAGAIGLGASTAQAEDFGASATLENTLTVTVVNDLDVGTVFATVTGAALTNGVGALVIAAADGAITDPTDSASVNLVSLGTATPAQGSIAMTADFNMVLPDTSAVDATDFVANAGGAADTEITAGAGVTELVHSSANPSVPSLYLMHFTVSDVSGATSAEGTTNVGDFTITQDFGETEYVFNIGATVTTEPTAAAATYQAGVYSGTFAVTASY